MPRHPDLDELLALKPGNAVWTDLDFDDLPGAEPLPLVHSYGKYLKAAQATEPGYEGLVLVGALDPSASNFLASFALPQRLALPVESDSDILLAADVALEAGRTALREAVLARQVSARELFRAIDHPHDEYESGPGEWVVVARDRVVGAYWVFEPVAGREGWRVVGVDAALHYDPPLPRTSDEAHRAGAAIAQRRRRERQAAEAALARHQPAVSTASSRAATAELYLSDLRPAPMRSDVLQAIVFSPKADRLFAAYGTKNVRISERLGARSPRSGEQIAGVGNFDERLIGQCLRTHTPRGVTAEATGQGVALYAALAVVAYQAFDVPCVGSAPAGQGYGYRTPDGDRIWAKLAGAGGRPALAEPSGVCDGCLSLSLETLIGAGFVVWMAEPGEYEGLIAEAQSVFRQAFAGAKARVSGESVAKLLGELFGRGAREMQANTSRRRVLSELYPGLTDL